MTVTELTKEIYEDIKGFEGLYQISNYGNIKSLSRKGSKKDTILKNKNNKNGYLYISLRKYNKTFYKSIHRLVATHFIENDKKKKTVNHIDGNKKNNIISNLEWCTYSENIKHSFKKLGRKQVILWKNKKGKNHPRSKPVNQYDLNNNFIKSWESLTDVEKKLGFKKSTLSKCCFGKYKTAYGYIWKYESKQQSVLKAAEILENKLED